MRRVTVASLAALLVLVTIGVSTAQKQAAQKQQAERITNGPVVKKTTDTVAEIAWSTDAPGSSIVKYGASPNLLNQTAEAPWGGTKEPNGDYNHTVWVKNLKPNTTYYFEVETTQGAGTNTSTQSRPMEFHTMAK
jgi:phosphodiesterase/alkaline phosphatase D-like protein